MYLKQNKFYFLITFMVETNILWIELHRILTFNISQGKKRQVDSGLTFLKHVLLLSNVK